ncbi:RagB/SusD family nutrient uptake outer membrane protein [Alistipes putredinis]|uniref:RagB/SusD family nutrient uptake outer membrane protein n=1 Tax=Alistipes putredinis TaxID=28117 RepID=UPI0039912260
MTSSWSCTSTDHHERHVELALEFDRFYDLVRWQEFSIAGAEDGASACSATRATPPEQIHRAASGAGRRLERRTVNRSRLC